MPAEFELIKHYFAPYPVKHPNNILGIGDDCALLQTPAGYRLAVTVDTLVEGVHFFADVDPADLGFKSLAVNLSDLASMGATPFAVTLAMTLPQANEAWLSAFTAGFMELAGHFSVDLVGGDTTSGPLSVTVQAMGTVPVDGVNMRRSSALLGDLIYVTGHLGSAGLGLKVKQGYRCAGSEVALQRFNRPHPRIDEGLAIRSFAHACIDVSDGLAADLNHILTSSQVGACLQWEAIPVIPAVQDYVLRSNDWHLPLTAGDDYELCFTIAAEDRHRLPEFCTCIGVIEHNPGLRISKDGQIEPYQVKGFEHFR